MSRFVAHSVAGEKEVVGSTSDECAVPAAGRGGRGELASRAAGERGRAACVVAGSTTLAVRVTTLATRGQSGAAAAQRRFELRDAAQGGFLLRALGFFRGEP